MAFTELKNQPGFLELSFMEQWLCAWHFLCVSLILTKVLKVRRGRHLSDKKPRFRVVKLCAQFAQQGRDRARTGTWAPTLRLGAGARTSSRVGFAKDHARAERWARFLASPHRAQGVGRGAQAALQGKRACSSSFGKQHSVAWPS